MKLIEKRAANPVLIWGEKYLIAGETRWGDIPEGTTVIVVETEPDGDGEVSVYSETDYDYIKPENLQLICEDSSTQREPAYIVELTESELQAIVTGIGASSLHSRKESAKLHGYSELVAREASDIFNTIKHGILGGNE